MGKHERIYPVPLRLHSLKATDELLSYFHLECLTTANGLPVNETPESRVVRLFVLGSPEDRTLVLVGNMQT